MGPSWGRLRWSWSRLGAVLGSSWGRLGRSSSLAPCWCRLGPWWSRFRGHVSKRTPDLRGLSLLKKSTLYCKLQYIRLFALCLQGLRANGCRWPDVGRRWPQDSSKMASWGHLVASWSRLGAILGLSWVVWGPSWGHLGRSDSLGPSWGRFGAVFERQAHLKRAGNPPRMSPGAHP